MLRELAVACYGSELVYLLGLAFLLAGTAGGTLAGRALAAPRPRPPGALFLPLAGLLPATVVLARALHRLLGGTPGAFLAFPAQLAGLALVLLPVGALGGLLFQRAAAAAVAAGGTLARAYAVESLGGLTGGAATTLAVALGVSNLATALLAAAMAAAAAALPAANRTARTRRAAFAVAAAALALLTVAGRIDRATTGWNHPGLVASVDTPYGRTTVVRRAEQVAVFQNGALAWESEGTAAEEMVHVAALAVPSPRAVLLLGGSVEGLVAEVLRHGPERVDLVEVDRRQLDALLPWLPAAARAALAAHAVRLELGEPRDLLSRGGRYDLILVGQPEPDSGQANRFYTREFFAACAARLAPDGALALRLAGAENLWTPLAARRTASVARALAAVFPAVALLPGRTNLVLASPTRLDLDPELLARRLRARRIESRLVTPPYLRYLLTNDRRTELAARLARTAAPENRDTRPICYQLTLLLWLSRFFPTLARLEIPAWTASPALAPAAGALVALGAALAAALVRRRPALRRALLVAATGAFGMILEATLVLAYQVERGVLFQDLGLLLTLFMAGLAAGSAWADRRLGAQAGRRTGAGIVLAAAAIAAGAAALLAGGIDLGLPGAALLLLAAGGATGALFGYASLAGVAAPGAVVAPLYAADLAGGSVGALAGTLLLLPLLGLPGTALLLGVATLALLLLL